MDSTNVVNNSARIVTKIKFSKSNETGALVGFVHKDPETGRTRGVRPDAKCPKKICLLPQKLSLMTLENILYKCSIVEIPGMNAYKVEEAEPVQFPAEVATSYIKGAKYLVTVRFGNKTIVFNPYSGTCKSEYDLEECKKVLENRVDVQNLLQVVDDFVEAGNSILALMMSDNVKKRY